MLKDSLPQFVREMREMALLLNVDQVEVDRMEAYIGEVIRQFCISSATYSIADWEREFGIEKNSTLTLEQRRAQVLAKLNTRTTATIKMIENLVVTVLGNKSVEIVENYQDYSFSVVIRSDYVLENMMMAKSAVHNARPAHLGYEFINKIARDSLMQLYIGMAGRKVKEEMDEIDLRRRKRKFYVGITARMVRTTEGDVTK
ncbi:MAG: YmfQ family protein [Lachnospiraceae bacterium]|nr:YmfQ family protein [Lachnospiraceae bacterium]